MSLENAAEGCGRVLGLEGCFLLIVVGFLLLLLL
jgi:hypothetical protein